MDRFRTVLQMHKTQQARPHLRQQPERPVVTQAISRPILYSHTRSIEIPLSVLRERRVMTAYDKGPFVEAYKILRTQVMHRLREQNWNVLGVTSPDQAEGKTLTAVNLAVSLAMETTQTVLLVDANLAAPSLHEFFGLDDDCPGLADYLLDEQPIEDLLLNPGIDGLVVLPGGWAVTNSAETLTSQKMATLVQEMKHRYQSRVVIFDLPPLLHTADALAFSPFVDALLLVVEEGKTTAEEVQQALSLVNKAHPVLGTVLNKAGQLTATPRSMRKMLENEVEG